MISAIKRRAQLRLCAATLFGASMSFGSPVLAADRIVNAATGDFNGDGAPDLATLTANADDDPTRIGIAIYLRDKERDILGPPLSVKNLFWGSALDSSLRGQEPTIAADRRGSILVSTKNEAVGRSRWTQTVTIAYRDGAFVVAGFAHDHRDTIDPSDSGRCDINLLTGNGIRNGKPLKTAPVRVKLSDWNNRMGMQACDPA